MQSCQPTLQYVEWKAIEKLETLENGKDNTLGKLDLVRLPNAKDIVYPISPEDPTNSEKIKQENSEIWSSYNALNKLIEFLETNQMQYLSKHSTIVIYHIYCIAHKKFKKQLRNSTSFCYRKGFKENE